MRFFKAPYNCPKGSGRVWWITCAFIGSWLRHSGTGKAHRFAIGFGRNVRIVLKKAAKIVLIVIPKVVGNLLYRFVGEVQLALGLYNDPVR